MCNRFRRMKGYAELTGEFSHIKLPLLFPEPHLVPNLAPQPVIRPTDRAAVLRRRDHGVEMVTMRWGLLPAFFHGAVREWRYATFNARSEELLVTRSFREPFRSRRCLVPADGWVEWTGARGEKRAWSVDPRPALPICFAGLWERTQTSDAGVVESFTIVTQPSGPPLDAYHPRSPVVLCMDEWATWLDLAADVGQLLHRPSRDLIEITPHPADRDQGLLDLFGP